MHVFVNLKFRSQLCLTNLFLVNSSVLINIVHLSYKVHLSFKGCIVYFLSFHQNYWKILCKYEPDVPRSAASNLSPLSLKNFMLNPADHGIFPANKCLNANNCWHFNIYELENSIISLPEL